MNLMGRKTPLNIYAPGNYDIILNSHLRDFDIELGFEIKFISLTNKNPELILDDKHLTVTAFPLVHRITSFGFLFREKPKDKNIIKECIDKYDIPVSRVLAIKRGDDFVMPNGEIIKNEILTLPSVPPVSYAYCSDTRYFSRLSSIVKGVTVLYHEATFASDNQKLAKTTFHSTSHDAAVTAKNAEAQTLIIGHFSSRYKNINPLVDEARAVFPRTFPAIDGKSYEIVSDNIEY
jgi:ribonuclease Z